MFANFLLLFVSWHKTTAVSLPGILWNKKIKKAMQLFLLLEFVLPPFPIPCKKWPSLNQKKKPPVGGGGGGGRVKLILMRTWKCNLRYLKCLQAQYQ